MSAVQWEATGDHSSAEPDTLSRGNRCSTSSERELAPPTDPGSPIGSEITAKIISVEDKINRMKTLIEKLPDVSDDASDTPATDVQSFGDSGLDEQNIQKLKTAIMNQKQYLDSCVYDDSLASCLESPGNRSVVSTANSRGGSARGSVSADHAEPFGISDKRTVKSNGSSSNVVRSMMKGLSECISTLPSEMLHSTGRAAGTITSSKESTTVVKKVKKSKKSVATTKDKKQTKSKKGVSKMCSEEGKEKRLQKVQKKVKLCLKTVPVGRPVSSKVSRLGSRKTANSVGVTQKNDAKKGNVCLKAKVPSKCLEGSVKTADRSRNEGVQREEKRGKRGLSKLCLNAVADDARECRDEAELWPEKHCPGRGEVELLTARHHAERERHNAHAHARYTQPTLASELKQVQKAPSYDNYRYPFVVGQSVNKSHNLGVNVQQLLSLMKKKHFATKNVAPKSERVRCDASVRVRTTRNGRCCPAIVEDDADSARVDVDKCDYQWVHTQLDQANENPQKLRPRCNCMQKSFVNYKEVLRNFLRQRYSSIAGSDVINSLPISKSCFSKRTSATNIDNRNANEYINFDSKVYNYNTNCEREEGINGNQYNDNFQTNKIRTTSSVYLASVLHKIKQYQARLENIKHEPIEPNYR